MRVYAASKFENQAAVREVYRALREDGHTITHDWTEEDASQFEGDALEEYLCTCAEKDVRGVVDSEALLLLHYPKVSGAITEFGIALCKAWQFPGSQLIIVIDAHKPENPRNIFFHLKFVRHAADLTEARRILKAHQVVLDHRED